MNEDERELVLMDITPRLAYGVILHIDENVEHWDGDDVPVETDSGIGGIDAGSLDMIFKAFRRGDIDIRPYLRPMDDEARRRIGAATNSVAHEMGDGGGDCSPRMLLPALVCYLHAGQYDYNGLIGRGLALEAPADMYSPDGGHDDDIKEYEL